MLGESPDAGGLGYLVYSVPQNQILIGSNGKLNPNATLGNVLDYDGKQYMLMPDNWRKHGLRDGFRQEYTFNLSGGNEKSSFYASVGYLSNEGITYGSKLERFTTKIKADYQAYPWLRVGGNASYTNSISDSQNDSFNVCHNIAPIYPLFIRDGNGEILTDEHGPRYDYGDGGNAGLVRTVEKSANSIQTDRINTYRTSTNNFNIQGFANIDFLNDFRAAADPKHCVNLAIVAEGYTVPETEKFYRKAQMLDSALFQQAAFRDCAKYFNVVAVMVPSAESGVSVPSAQKQVNSALGAHFDSFGLERLMTISDTKALWDALENVPASQIIILANTDKYGGSGAHNEYAIGADGIPHFEEVVIHEFGHSFATLGDEYESGFDDLYSSDEEPREPNITTLKDFSSKWQNLIDSGEVTLIEGAGYQPKGVWRGSATCLMRAIEDHDFCPVCSRAIARTVQYFVGEIAGLD